METSNVNILTALLFGFLSFISPCVLPIVPGYISFISGVSLDAMKNESEKNKLRNLILLRTIFFILGFSIVFVALGASATAIGQFLLKQLNVISKIAGAIIIVFGLHMIGIFKIPFLNYEKRFQTEGKPLSFIGAFVVGLAFAFGWTPCIGPTLGAVQTLALIEASATRGAILSFAYCIGLGLPFIAFAFTLERSKKLRSALLQRSKTISIIGGSFLILIGLLQVLGVWESLMAGLRGTISGFIPVI